jgi:YhcH/YjgK/YiaL family protein
MVLDTLENSPLYAGLGASINKAFTYLKETDFTKVEPGQYEIDGTSVFAMVSHYNTKEATAGFWEAHKKHIDVQYIAEGIETIKVTNIERVKVLKSYDAEKDFGTFEGPGDSITLNKGSFAIFFPADVHMPGLHASGLTPVVKVVVKVKID